MSMVNTTLETRFTCEGLTFKQVKPITLWFGIQLCLARAIAPVAWKVISYRKRLERRAMYVMRDVTVELESN